MVLLRVCSYFAGFERDWGRIDKHWHDPYETLYGSHQPLLDSRRDTRLDLTDTQEHDPCQPLYGSCQERSRNRAFREQIESRDWSLKRCISCSRRQVRLGRAGEKLGRAKERLGEEKRSEKAKVGLRISFSIAHIMISPLYLSFYCIRNMFE